MRKNIEYIAIALITLLGLVHTSMTPIFYKTFDLSALWFAGTGLSFVFLGILNLARIKTADAGIKILCTIANGIAVAYGVFIVIKLAKPHAYFSFFILILLFALSLIDLRSQKK